MRHALTSLALAAAPALASTARAQDYLQASFTGMVTSTRAIAPPNTRNATADNVDIADLTRTAFSPTRGAVTGSCRILQSSIPVTTPIITNEYLDDGFESFTIGFGAAPLTVTRANLNPGERVGVQYGPGGVFHGFVYADTVLHRGTGFFLRMQGPDWTIRGVDPLTGGQTSRVYAGGRISPMLGNQQMVQPPTDVVPEPGTYALLGAGLLAVGGIAARRRTA